MSNLVTVRVRDCACPGRPHANPAAYNGSGDMDGDVVFLREKASLPLGIAVQTDMQVALREADGADVSSILTARWVVSYVRHGAVGWNFLDKDGRPVPFDPQVLIDDFELGKRVGDRADELYGDTVVRPLLPKPSTPSQPGATGDTTSAPPTPIRKSRGRSSPATTAATAPSTP